MIRLRDDRTAPSDNTFVNSVRARPEVFSYGHRHSRCIAINRACGSMISGSLAYQNLRRIWFDASGRLAGHEALRVRQRVRGLRQGRNDWLYVLTDEVHHGVFHAEGPNLPLPIAGEACNRRGCVETRGLGSVASADLPRGAYPRCPMSCPESLVA